MWTATKTSLKTLDRAENPRVACGSLDMGAYERQTCAIVVCGGTNIVIPDRLLTGATNTLTFPDMGTAQTLTLTANFSNAPNAMNSTRISLVDPDGVETVLWCGIDIFLWESCVGNTSATRINTSYPDITPTHFGDLSTWVGKNPVGDWSITGRVQSVDGNSGEITSWCVTATF